MKNEKILSALTLAQLLHAMPSESFELFRSSSMQDAVMDSTYVGAMRIDSRLVQSQDVFVAFEGQHVDGHEYVEKALCLGALCIIVTQAWAQANKNQIGQLLAKNTDAIFIAVTDQTASMACIGGAYRQAHQNVPFVAITGSVGKTTVKSMLSHILQTYAPTLATINSQNNHLGVPMTLSRLTTDTILGVAELGANHSGEIAAGVSLVQPQVAVLTGVNTAHIEGFGSLNNTAHAKAEIFSTLSPNGIAILNRDDDYFELWRSLLPEHQHYISFGVNEAADIQLLSDATFILKQKLVSFSVGADVIDTPIHFSMPLLGRHNQLNGVIALAAALAIGHYTQALWQQQLVQNLACVFESLEPVAGRLVPFQLMPQLTLIDDTYNASPQAVREALEYLRHQSGASWFVFGGMGELGEQADEFHRVVGEQAAAAGVQQFWAYGVAGAIAAEAYAKACTDKTAGAIGCFEAHSSLNAALTAALKNTFSSGSAVKPDLILVKGARSSKMEKIVNHLHRVFESK